MHRKVELPAGVVVARLPGPIEVSTDLLQASRKIAVTTSDSRNVIDDDFSLAIATGTVARGDYARFVTAAHATDDAFLASTWLSKDVKVSAAPP
jgi:hypothetical protein